MTLQEAIIEYRRSIKSGSEYHPEAGRLICAAAGMLDEWMHAADADGRKSVTEKVFKLARHKGNRLFLTWQAHAPALTEDAFMREAAWVVDDPKDEQGRLTRLIGLKADGSIERLKYCHVRLEADESLTRLGLPMPRDETTIIVHLDGSTWEGDRFYQALSKEQAPMWGDEHGGSSFIFKVAANAIEIVRNDTL